MDQNNVDVSKLAESIVKANKEVDGRVFIFSDDELKHIKKVANVEASESGHQ